MEMTFTTTEAARLRLLERAVGGSGAVFAGAKLHLFKNPVQPGPETKLSDLTEADFDAYAAANITWGSVLLEPGGSASVDGGTIDFIAGANQATSETIYGAYIAANFAGNGATPDTLLGAGVLDNPVSISEPNQGIRLEAIIRYPDEA